MQYDDGDYEDVALKTIAHRWLKSDAPECPSPPKAVSGAGRRGCAAGAAGAALCAPVRSACHTLCGSQGDVAALSKWEAECRLYLDPRGEDSGEDSGDEGNE